jgi:hypothetical protein
VEGKKAKSAALFLLGKEGDRAVRDKFSHSAGDAQDVLAWIFNNHGQVKLKPLTNYGLACVAVGIVEPPAQLAPDLT